MRAINGSCDASVSMHGERLLGVLIVSFSKKIPIMRIIVHVHMDAFYAAAEELLDRRAI